MPLKSYAQRLKDEERELRERQQREANMPVLYTPPTGGAPYTVTFKEFCELRESYAYKVALGEFKARQERDRTAFEQRFCASQKKRLAQLKQALEKKSRKDQQEALWRAKVGEVMDDWTLEGVIRLMTAVFGELPKNIADVDVCLEGVASLFTDLHPRYSLALWCRCEKQMTFRATAEKIGRIDGRSLSGGSRASMFYNAGVRLLRNPLRINRWRSLVVPFWTTGLL